MKFLKKILAFTMVFACVLGFSGCGNKDLRIFEEDITAVVNGEKQSVFYVEQGTEHEPGVTELMVHDGASRIYYSLKDKAKTISGKSNDVTLRFAEVKPIFRVEDVGFRVIAHDGEPIPDDDRWYDYRIQFPVSNFQSKRGETSFHFEIDKLFFKDSLMLCIAIMYSYDVRYIFIPMHIPAEYVGEQEGDPDNEDWMYWY